MPTSFSEKLNSRLSALLITHNEELNIKRTLKALEWIPKILVIDSGSNDNTVKLIKSFPNAEILHRNFDNFANQCNFGLSKLTSEWVLSLDADYVLSSALSDEIYDLMIREPLDTLYDAYSIPFSYCINGKPIRSGLLPPRICLYRLKLAEYVNIGHGHKVLITGRIGKIRSRMYHDDRKPLKKWIQNQQNYQQKEAILLKGTKTKDLVIQDIIRKHTFLAPFLIFLMCILVRRGFLDGKEGLIYAFQRFITESLLYIYLHDDSSV